MREILFRGKREDGAWVYGYYMYDLWNDNKHYIIADYGNADKGYAYKVIPETVGQYTGLTDKNGTKIFEGDVVHYVYEPLGNSYWNANQNCVIEWRSAGFYLNGIMGTNLYACVSGWLVSIPHGDGALFEVIGNIHDNPEGVQ